MNMGTENDAHAVKKGLFLDFIIGATSTSFTIK